MNSVRHGFVRATSGTITKFDAPGAGTKLPPDAYCALPGTGGFSINGAGETAGMYLDADAVYHGFVRTADGAITTIDAPDAGAGARQGTGAFGINTAEMVVGTSV
jgi:hypothetical protein